jgi:steroid delta-isomerase-like uncharacterized protein
MAGEDNKATIGRLLEEGFGEGNTGLVDELVSEELELNMAPPGLRPGRDGMKHLFEWLRRAFPDLKATVKQQIAEDNRVGTELWLEGTHEGPLFVFQPSGNRMKLEGLHLSHFDDEGKLSAHGYVDSFAPMLQQLELVPPPEDDYIQQPDSPPDWRKYGETGTLEENKAVVRRLLEDAWDKGDVSVCEEIVAVDAIDHNPFPGEPLGREGIVHMLMSVRDAAPDYHEVIQDMVAEGDKVMAFRDVTATLVKPYGGVPPTDKKISLPGIAVFRIAGGNVVERWGHFHIIGVLQQTGLIPNLHVDMEPMGAAAPSAGGEGGG